MNYSTYNNKNFFIKKNSTLPVLKYALVYHILQQYDITEDMLDNVAVTFSMTDADTGLYRIANAPANLIINKNRPEFPDETKYTLAYRFKLKDTRKTGNYLGEFVIDFLDDEAGCGKIKFPTHNKINIVISDSSTKTTVQ
jgi:hypothetical protein